MGRKSGWVVGAVMALGVLSAGKAFAEDVTGILVDNACYTFSKDNTTMAHKGMTETCAADCAKKGNQLSVVAKDGTVYQIMGTLTADNNAKLVPHMAHNVVLTGKIEKGEAGKPSKITATAIKMAP